MRFSRRAGGRDGITFYSQASKSPRNHLDFYPISCNVYLHLFTYFSMERRQVVRMCLRDVACVVVEERMSEGVSERVSAR